jgi:hypothetical protein
VSVLVFSCRDAISSARATVAESAPTDNSWTATFLVMKPRHLTGPCEPDLSFVLRGLCIDRLSVWSRDLLPWRPDPLRKRQLSGKHKKIRASHETLPQAIWDAGHDIVFEMKWIWMHVHSFTLWFIFRHYRYRDDDCDYYYCRSSSPCRVKNFHFSISSRPVLGPTQPRIQWVPGVLSPG